MTPLLDVTLSTDSTDFGPAGTQLLINMRYVVGIEPNGSGSKFFVNKSDVATFVEIEVTEPFDQWRIVTLNP